MPQAPNMSDLAAREMLSRSLGAVEGFLTAITDEQAEPVLVDQDLQRFRRSFPADEAVSALAALTSLGVTL